MFKEFFCLCKLAIFPAPSVIQLRVPTGILDLEEVGAGLKTGLFPRPASSCPLEAIRFSCQIAGGESWGSPMESLSKIVPVVLLKRYFY